MRDRHMQQLSSDYSPYASYIRSSVALKTTLVAKNQMEIEGQMAIQLIEQTGATTQASNEVNKGININIHV